MGFATVAGKILLDTGNIDYQLVGSKSKIYPITNIAVDKGIIRDFDQAT